MAEAGIVRTRGGVILLRGGAVGRVRNGEAGRRRAAAYSRLTWAGGAAFWLLLWAAAFVGWN